MANSTIKNHPRAQIVATLGPISSDIDHVRALARAGADVFRLNFSWGTLSEHAERIEHIRQIEKELGMPIIILQDVPGPRIQESAGHTYDHSQSSALTDHDRECIVFGVEHGVDCVALSFVGSAKDVEECRSFIREKGGTQPVVAKIERAVALDNLPEIVSSADAVMVARGDLGEEIPLERIPFVQADIIRAANRAGKPVITATQMMLSMVDHPEPTRAEVTDVESAIMQGSDAVMLSEETAKGMYSVEAVTMMEKVVSETEKHMAGRRFNLLKRISA
jgi:pyruvate kinase